MWEAAGFYSGASHHEAATPRSRSSSTSHPRAGLGHRRSNARHYALTDGDRRGHPRHSQRDPRTRRRPDARCERQRGLRPDGQSVSDPKESFHSVKPSEFDPSGTHLVQAAWLHGIGCPTDATTTAPTSSFTDPACPTGDPRDQRNQGLLLVKTGPTENNAAGIAELKKVRGITLTDLGYDIRKSGGSGASPLGSHCGAGAPRFDVITTDGLVHFIGCNSPPAVVAGASSGWVRLRWDPATAFPPVSETVQRILIVFDEGQDPSGGPDSFGAAILDNIDVNGVLVGRGATDAD